MRGPRVHPATIRARLRTDRGLLVLIGLVVAVTTALTAAVPPLGERTADRAIAASVRDAGQRGAVVATAPQGYDDPTGATRDPLSDVHLREDAERAHQLLPRRLKAVLRPGVATLATPALRLLDDGPGRYLRLVYVDTPSGPPAVTYTAGGPPRSSVGPARAGLTVRGGQTPWPVQVALAEGAAAALHLAAGDRVPAEDEQHRRFSIVISGIYAPADPEAAAWQASTQLMHPSVSVADGVPSASAAALVSAASLPDLRVGVPADDLNHRITFAPRPARVRWRDSAALERDVVALQASGRSSRGDITWDSRLARVLDEGRADVASARAQAQVLLLGLLACALLVLVLAAHLLDRRRRGSVVLARERGATLLGIGLELLAEAAVVAVGGAVVGLAAIRVLVGAVGWTWSVPVVLVAASSAPVLGMLAAARATSAPRPRANRSARRAALRARRWQRGALEIAVVVVAVLSFVALRQRGAGDLTAASATMWWAVAGTLAVIRLLPHAVGLLLRTARRSTGEVRFLVAARLAEAGGRALPLLVVAVALAQLTLGAVLATTERAGQSAGALQAVGGDARLTAPPDRAVTGIARSVDAAPGVRAAVAARVADDVQVSSRRSAETVRLVVVDPQDYERLLAAAGLPGRGQVARLREASGEGGRMPALLRGDTELRDGLVLQWERASIPLDVVGEASRVDASGDPEVIVATSDLSAAGTAAEPDTVWAVGPGAAAALRAAAGPSGAVVTYADVLHERRHAPLASGLVRLAAASAAVLLVIALLGAALAAAVEAPARAVSLGRLRALGLPDPGLARVLAGELLVPVVVSVVVGVALGVGSAYATFGSLSLEQITGAAGAADPVLPWWLLLLVGAAVPAAILLVALTEWRRLRRKALAQLLRS